MKKNLWKRLTSNYWDFVEIDKDIEEWKFYEIEKILKKQITKRKIKYLIRWLDWNSEWNE